MPAPLHRRAVLLAAAALLTPQALRAQDDYEPVLQAFQSFVFGTSTDITKAIAFLGDRGRPDVASALIVALRYTRTRARRSWTCWNG